jgi:DNA-binding MarR family transcriptional regulator
MSEDSLIEQIIELFASCVYTIQTTTQPDWLHLDLTVAQIKVLFVLLLHGPLSVSDLAEQLHVGQPTASHLADRLVRVGWVRRQESPNDRRYTLVQLTEEGRGLVERLRQGRVEPLRHCLHELSPDELADVQCGLALLIRALHTLPQSLP